MTAVAVERIFDTIGADPEVVQAPTMGTAQEENSGAIGRYGPADMKIDTGGHQASQTGIYHDFKVVVKRSCDDDDPLADS
jgi:hypothetical protein